MHIYAPQLDGYMITNASRSYDTTQSCPLEGLCDGTFLQLNSRGDFKAAQEFTPHTSKVLRFLCFRVGEMLRHLAIETYVT